jgi:hypothetical protein
MPVSEKKKIVVFHRFLNYFEAVFQIAGRMPHLSPWRAASPAEPFSNSMLNA